MPWTQQADAPHYTTMKLFYTVRISFVNVIHNSFPCSSFCAEVIQFYIKEATRVHLNLLLLKTDNINRENGQEQMHHTFDSLHNVDCKIIHRAIRSEDVNCKRGSKFSFIMIKLSHWLNWVVCVRPACDHLKPNFSARGKGQSHSTTDLSDVKSTGH